MQSGRIKKNKRGPERYFDGVTLREQGVGSSVRTARAVRTEMTKEEVTAANIRNASTLTFLRIRPRNIRSDYERLWRCHLYCDKVPLLNDSKEGDGDDDSRIQELRSYVVQHGCVVEDLRAKVERSPRSKSAWKKCNRGRCSIRRMFLERVAAAVQNFRGVSRKKLKVHVHRKHQIRLSVQRPWYYTRNSMLQMLSAYKEN